MNANLIYRRNPRVRVINVLPIQANDPPGESDTNRSSNEDQEHVKLLNILWNIFISPYFRYSYRFSKRFSKISVRTQRCMDFDILQNQNVIGLRGDFHTKLPFFDFNWFPMVCCLWQTFLGDHSHCVDHYVLHYDCKYLDELEWAPSDCFVG